MARNNGKPEGLSESSREDIQLVDALKSGDKRAFDALYRKYSPFIKHYIFDRVRNQRMVDDMTQDILMRVYSSIDKYRVESTFSAWVWRIMKNYMVDYYRKDPRVTLSTAKNLGIACEDTDSDTARQHVMVFENTLAGPGLEADLRIRDRERKECVRSLLGVVNDRERRVLEMFFFEGKTYEEIACELEVPMNNMKIVMYRAKEKIRKHIGSYERIEGLLS
jgi:RNA polymerase sigma-70 factor (ECF subfamily)